MLDKSMKKEEPYFTILDGTRVAYHIRKSHRAKNIRMTFADGDSLVVTLPYNCPIRKAELALSEHENWILRKIKEKQTKSRMPPPFLLNDGAHLPVLDKTYPLSITLQNKKSARWY
ncbi:MAG: M48 family metallopeptidase, partial [Candidatus Aminicenantes bacterium]|nr:M48 family metallopeptidase [Candidatus Aminicenantes bacterium]